MYTEKMAKAEKVSMMGRSVRIWEISTYLGCESSTVIQYFHSVGLGTGDVDPRTGRVRSVKSASSVVPYFAAMAAINRLKAILNDK